MIAVPPVFGTSPHGLSVNFYKILFMKSALRAFFLASWFLFMSASFAFTPADVLAPFSFYNSPDSVAVSKAAGVSYFYEGRLVSGTNPHGYQAGVNGAGQPVVESVATVRVSPPSGAPVSSSTSAAAVASAGGAGAAAAVGTLVKSAPLASGVASAMAKAALGVGVGASAVLLSPAVATVLTAASIGSIGFDLYKALRDSGVAVAPDGSATWSQGGQVSGMVKYWGMPNLTPKIVPQPEAEMACAAVRAGYAGSSYIFGPLVVSGSDSYHACDLRYASGQIFLTGQVWNTFGMGCPVGTVLQVGQCVASVQTSALTNDQLIAALNAATLSANVAADAANFALSRGVPLPPEATAAASTTGLTLASEFAEIKNSVDSLGVITKTLERNLLQVLPSVGGASPLVDVRREVVNLTNSIPQSVTNYSLAPNVETALQNVAKQKTDDLCQAHPDILACSDLSNQNDVTDTALLQKDISIVLNPIAISSSAVCPAPVVIHGVLGERVISFDVVCSSVALVRPLLLVFAWLTAGMIIFVGRPYSA